MARGTWSAASGKIGQPPLAVLPCFTSTFAKEVVLAASLASRQEGIHFESQLQPFDRHRIVFHFGIVPGQANQRIRVTGKCMASSFQTWNIRDNRSVLRKNDDLVGDHTLPHQPKNQGMASRRRAANCQ